MTDLVEKYFGENSLPEDCKGTDEYNLVQVLYSMGDLRTIPDLLKGGKRNKRWGAIISVGVIPGLDDNPPGPVMLPNTPQKFFDADTLVQLRARLVHELDKAIELAEIAKNDPEAYDKMQRDLQAAFQVEREPTSSLGSEGEAGETEESMSTSSSEA